MSAQMQIIWKEKRYVHDSAYEIIALVIKLWKKYRPMDIDLQKYLD
jgi:hypothetical protein